ncbi:MAG: hypothetical protein BYD32DRAFT_402528 [Podila humilis]|nr:MAG: hypothetical protein BYD32DRAFT_402528 [Podila humilis]
MLQGVVDMMMQSIAHPTHTTRETKEKKCIGPNMCDPRGIDWFRHKRTSNTHNRRDTLSRTLLLPPVVGEDEPQYSTEETRRRKGHKRTDQSSDRGDRKKKTRRNERVTNATDSAIIMTAVSTLQCLQYRHHRISAMDSDTLFWTFD